MKSRVDIFRPLAAAARSTTAGPTSIFRRNGNGNNGSGGRSDVGNDRDGGSSNSIDDDDTYVVSVPPAAWPPHPAALSTSASDGQQQQQQGLDRSAPLPTSGTGAASSGEEEHRSSPLGSSRRSLSTSMRSAGRSMSPLKRRKSAKKADPKSNKGSNGSGSGGKKKNEATPPRAPSYYKIELVQDHANGGTGGSLGGQQVQLTAGDDSSVQLTPNHNRGLQLASSSVSLGDDGGGTGSARKQRIIRASPIVEHEAVEHELDVEVVKSSDGRRNGGWTVTNNDGQIVIAMPPSPSPVANGHVAEKKKELMYCTKEPAVSESIVKKTGKKAGGGQPRDDMDLSVPPRLVKANSTTSHSTSSSSGSEHSFLLSHSPGGGNGNGNIGSIGNNNPTHHQQPPPLPNQGSHPATTGSKGSASASLESPPRMNRSVLDDSLFQDSVDSGSGEAASGSKEGRDRSRPPSANSSGHGGSLAGSGGGQGKRGGCGARLPDIFTQILDAFSLGGGCCRQGDTSSCSTVAATARV